MAAIFDFRIDIFTRPPTVLTRYTHQPHQLPGTLPRCLFVRWSVVVILLMVMVTACRQEQNPIPQNVVQYKLGGSITGRIQGRTSEITNLNDTFNLEAYYNQAQAVFYRDTLSFPVIRDTGTGPFVVMVKNNFVRFNLYRFSPTTGSSLTLQFPLWKRTDDTAAHFLGILATQDLRQFLTDSAFVQVEAKVANRPTGSSDISLDPRARIQNIVWDSAAGRISGKYQYRIYKQRSPFSPVLDSMKVQGQFALPVVRAIR